MIKKQFTKATHPWARYVKAKFDLRKSKFIWSYRQAEADFSVWLVKEYFHAWKLSPKQSHNILTTNDGRITQVRSIAKNPKNKFGYKIKDKDRNSTATQYAFVYFNDLIPEAIFLTPAACDLSNSEIKLSDIEKYRLKNIDLTPFKKAWKDLISGD